MEIKILIFLNKCNNPDLLNKIIERLENKITKTDEVIIQQEKGRNQLLQKIEKPEKLIQPYLKILNNIFFFIF